MMLERGGSASALMMRAEGCENSPKLSAAITTPSLYLQAITEVPVTRGDWVWVVGPFVWSGEWLYEPYISSRGW